VRERERGRRGKKRGKREKKMKKNKKNCQINIQTDETTQKKYNDKEI